MNSTKAMALLAACLAGGITFTCAAQAAQVEVHDPVMAQDGARYYVFSTGPGITFYSSADMKDWVPEGRVFAGEPAWAKRVAPQFDGHVWAPDVVRHDGKFLLYYSVSSFGKNTSGIGVTVNKTLDPRSPDYRWEDQGMVLRSLPNRDEWNAIDPAVIADKAGNGWMAFGSFWGGLKLVRLDASWTRPAEPQQWHTIATRAPTLTPAGEAAPQEVEAPFIFKKGDWYYLFASWGLCCQKEKSTYHVVVGRARDVTGPYLDKDGKDMAKGGGTLVVKGNRNWIGVGHNSAYTFDGRDVLVLHAYETADRYQQKLKVLDIGWDSAGWPTVDPAQLDSYQSRLLPAR
ncbi:arabinan endo-1,5-alpha-L-arabinosidase [[Empedobacter] haloabium]|uniref:Extracellular exo-alpha-(1->5)-L-arabinofuranosidase n=1 Tax=[Empedobacter] haloabium TaxID=592317 RepID=A0ABZ1UGQ0_9BURK